MKNILFTILILIFISCKKEQKAETTELKKVQVLDTIYCDSEPITINNKMSMYNSHFTSIISRNPLKDQKIIINKGQNIEVCYHNEIDIILLEKNDTVYNITINMDTIFNNISPYDKNMFKAELKNLKLESITVNRPRAEYLYYYWKYIDLTTNEFYFSMQTFTYVGKTGSRWPYNFSRLINSYLKEQDLEKTNQKFGDPIAQEIFIMDGGCRI